MEKGKRCALYSILSEVCLVVDKNEEGKWAISTNDDGSLIGCASETLELASYTRIKHVEKKELVSKIHNVHVRIRSYDDPAIQAILLTDGTFVIGMDPKVKMALSISGIILSIFCFGCIAKQCVLNCRGD